MGSLWLPTGSDSVRMKRTASGKLFKHLPGPPGPVFCQKTFPKIQNYRNLTNNIKSPLSLTPIPGAIPA